MRCIRTFKVTRTFNCFTEERAIFLSNGIQILFLEMTFLDFTLPLRNFLSSDEAKISRPRLNVELTSTLQNSTTAPGTVHQIIADTSLSGTRERI